MSACTVEPAACGENGKCIVDGTKSGFYCQCNANFSGVLCEVIFVCSKVLLRRSISYDVVLVEVYVISFIKG